MTRQHRRARRSRRRTVVLVTAGAVVAAVIAVLVVRAVASDEEPAAVDTRRSGATVSSRTGTAPMATVPPTSASTPTAPLPAQAAPPPGPPYAVGVATITVEDPSRPTAARGPTPPAPTRRLPVTVRYPAVGAPGAETGGAGAVAGRHPLVVFAHGYDIAAADYAELLRDLAAQGFVVAAPDFPRSSTVFPGPPTQADIDEQARDVAFLVDVFTDDRATGPWSGHVAAGEAGVVGHSDGGNTVARSASNSCCFAARIGAAAVLSGDEGTTGGEWGVPGAAPLLFVQGTADPINPWVLTQRLYDDARSPKMLVAVDGGDHLAPYTSGPARSAIVALVAAFFRANLVDAAARDQIPVLADAGDLRLVASS